jgi:Fic family protein
MVSKIFMNQTILESLRSKLLDRISFDTLPKSVWKRYAALNTWGTNAIEGSTITKKDAEKILLDEQSVAGRPIRDVMETIQHERAFLGLLERRKREITVETALELHEGVFRGILFDAGMFRRINVRIRGAKFTPPRMEKVMREIKQWESKYRKEDIAGKDAFELGAWMHFDFERIHPFGDGNGRVGRLLLNLHFLKRNWPVVHVLPLNRNDYLHGLNSADNEDFVPLSNLLRILMGASLVDLLDQVGTKKDRLVNLKKIAKSSPYSEKYLALRCKQGEIPSLKSGREWRTSDRVLDLYLENIARKK